MEMIVMFILGLKAFAVNSGLRLFVKNSVLTSLDACAGEGAPRGSKLKAGEAARRSLKRREGSFLRPCASVSEKKRRFTGDNVGWSSSVVGERLGPYVLN
jgi:hypothetical protein